ncbi:hypothetical protein EJ04DRAFT_548084 [Polyplosphaeria fusca]|uniref:Uncharacterized protein n=1 Tax=Polyplosphaeria fusca TaxID=682080 RepID=A0A9P4RDG8_9PLEO|nr:hypothetical protein EJ04DRAFT_548084 [Polyplosphaeria fusca]
MGIMSRPHLPPTLHHAECPASPDRPLGTWASVLLIAERDETPPGPVTRTLPANSPQTRPGPSAKALPVRRPSFHRGFFPTEPKRRLVEKPQRECKAMSDDDSRKARLHTAMGTPQDAIPSSAAPVRSRTGITRGRRLPTVICRCTRQTLVLTFDVSQTKASCQPHFLMYITYNLGRSLNDSTHRLLTDLT